MAGATILLVDDDHDHLTIATSALHHAGHGVLVAAEVSQALALARTGEPDVIICDIVFYREPVGLELVAALQRDEETSRIPILVYSSFTDMYEAELRALGVRHLLKRGATHELADAVAAILNSPNLQH